MPAQVRSDDVYPSRVDGESRFLPRRDPVIYGTSGPLSPVQIAQYERAGYLLLPEFLAQDEVTPLQQEALRLRADPAITALEETIREPGSDTIRSVFRVHELSPLVAKLVRNGRVLAIVQQLLGGDVYVHQSRVNYKPAFRGREFYWHSDFETWHIEDGLPRMRALSLAVNLTDNDAFNGPLMVVPESHRTYVSCVGETPADHYKQSLRVQKYGVPDDDSLRRLVEYGGIAAPTGPAGSILLFDCNLMHGSGSNLSPKPRTNLFVVYNSVNNAAVEPFGNIPRRPSFIASQHFDPVQPE